MGNPYARVYSRPLSYDRLYGIKKFVGVFTNIDELNTAILKSEINSYAILQTNSDKEPKIFIAKPSKDIVNIINNDKDIYNPDRESADYLMPTSNIDIGKYNYVCIQDQWFVYIKDPEVTYNQPPEENDTNIIIIPEDEEYFSSMNEVNQFINNNPEYDLTDTSKTFWVYVNPENEQYPETAVYYKYLIASEDGTTETASGEIVSENGWYPVEGWVEITIPGNIDDENVCIAVEMNDTNGYIGFTCPVKKELIIDYTNHIMYICDTNGDIVQISTLKDVISEGSESTDSSFSVTKIVSGENWVSVQESDTVSYYKNTITVDRITPDDVPTIMLLASIDPDIAKQEQEEYSKLYRVVSSEGYIELYTNEEPDTAISYNIRIQVIR